MWNDAKKLRIFLVVSFLLRLIYALRFSYLHPDEHLQGPQEILHGSFGWASQTPWEFTTEHPLRSFVPLWLIYGIPTAFFSADANPVYILYTLRAVFAVLTWVLEDMAVDRIASTRKDKIRSLFFVSTSYVTLTWQAHTLSNSLETILVLWCIVILFEAASRTAFQSGFDRHYDTALLGLIVVLGVFNRPTFIAFLLLPSLSLLKIWYRFPSCLVTFVVSVALSCAGFIYLDTLFYGNHEGWVITPLNFVRYNMHSDNLSEHGLHSRFTHLLVNLPQLLGPGLLLLRPHWRSLSMQTTVSALALLSVFPHQEARFLLPLAPILCSQMDFEQFRSPKVRRYLFNAWLAFNFVLGVIMGGFHQAGVIPGQVKIRELERPASVIWWKTYTPPLWVLGLPSNEVEYAQLSSHGKTQDQIETLVSQKSGSSDTALTEIDLQGTDVTSLQSILSHVPKHGQPFYLVAPLAKKKVLQRVLGKKYVDPMWSTFFHLDPDMFDISDFSSFRLGLGIWNVTGLL